MYSNTVMNDVVSTKCQRSFRIIGSSIITHKKPRICEQNVGSSSIRPLSMRFVKYLLSLLTNCDDKMPTQKQ